MLQSIRDNPHYSDEKLSWTTWQTDEILDFVEEKLFIIETAFRNGGLMQ